MCVWWLQMSCSCAHVLTEVAHRIAAEQRQAEPSGQLVPEDLEPDRGVGVSLLPQDVHHPAVGAQHRSRPALQDLIDEASDGRVEPFGIGEAVDHEAREHLIGVEDEKGPVAARVLDVNEAGAQAVRAMPSRCAAEAMIMAGSPATSPSARKAEAVENSPSSVA